MAVLLMLARASYAAPITYTGALTGAAENPPTGSPGTGTTAVVIDTVAHTLGVTINFSGLAGNTTAAHVHCCVVAPGNAGVATQTPSFVGFPLGVTSGAYTMVFDLTMASSWNAAYITANGGTPAGAEAALAAGLAAGQAYLNVHSSVNAGGEIRSFLTIPGSGQFTYTGTLTGAAENPPNASPGTGATTIGIDTVAHTLTVNVTFSGLLGTTTASHIHCCIAAPGNAGVATQTPTFAGFPLGVTSGTYLMTFDLTQASSWNPTYITNNGGTTATAEAALAAGMLAGQAYLNVHSNLFPGGEIRSFLVFVSPVELIDFSVQ